MSAAPISTLRWTPGFFRFVRLPWIYGAISDDPSDGEVVTFGGTGGTYSQLNGGTWVYAGGTWMNATPITSPTPRFGAAMAYDSTSREVVLFGGGSNTSINGTGVCRVACSDTWAYHNGSWVRLLPTHSPPRTVEGTLVDDPVDGGLLLFGGFEPGTNGSYFAPANATWEWNGTDWKSVAVTKAPSPRAYTAMAFDSSTNEVVLLGGLTFTRNGSQLVGLNDTWTFSGGTWTNRSGPIAPPAVPGVDLAYDASIAHVVLVARPSAAFLNNTTWSFGPSGWSVLRTGGTVPDPGGQQVVFDSTDGYLLDAPYGFPIVPNLSTYALRSGNWSRVSVQLAAFPTPRLDPGMAYDPATRSAVVFGGLNSTMSVLNDTWELRSNGTFVQIPSPANLTARAGEGFAFDSTLGASVLFGGVAGTGSPLNDLWTYSGTTWSRRPTNSTGPPAATYGCLVDDPLNAGVLYFGGFNAGHRPLSGTWIWNASGWTNVTGGIGPSPRGFPTCGWDPTLGKVLLVGGAQNVTTFQPSGTIDRDTWAFDGRAWTDQNVSGLAGTGVASGELVPFGAISNGGEALLPGWNGSHIATTTLVLQGSSWGPAPDLLPGSPPVEGAAVAADPAFGGTIVFGGGTSSSGTVRYINSVWSTLDLLEILPSVATLGPPANRTIAFSAGTIGNTSLVRYLWAFGDGRSASSASGLHAYATGGNFTGELTAVDAWGTRVAWNFTVDWGAASGGTPLALQSANVTPLIGPPPLNVAYSANATGGVGPYAYGWTFGDGGRATSPSGIHEYGSVGSFVLRVQVTDSAGATIEKNWTVQVSNAQKSGPGWVPPRSPGPSLPWLWLGLALAAVAAVVAVVLWRRRTPSRADAEAPPDAPEPASDEPPSP